MSLIRGGWVGIFGSVVLGQSVFEAHVAGFLLRTRVRGLISGEYILKRGRPEEIRLIAVAHVAIDESLLPGKRLLFRRRIALCSSVDCAVHGVR